MTSELLIFAARLREFIASSIPAAAGVRRLTSNSERGTRNAEFKSEPPRAGGHGEEFNAFALELFALQFAHNSAYRRICEARPATPLTVSHWSQIPAVPALAFKELELTCLPAKERTAVFHSSGTTQPRPSRHFHCAESLAVYEALVWPWFVANLLPDLKSEISDFKLSILTPRPAEAPHSSLVHMFDVVRQKLCADNTVFCGRLAADGGWALDFERTLTRLGQAVRGKNQLLLLATAFSFVQLLDFLAEQNLHFELPPGSRLMETGGYKGRSRSMPKAELHALITERLGIPPSHIVCEYGMSELSSQAYDKVTSDRWQVARGNGRASCHLSPVTCHFHFPPWARAQIISPETGLEVSEGETGLLRVFDLANVFSVMAIQTEDLGIRRGEGFELIGRAALSEPRGCSLLAV